MCLMPSWYVLERHIILTKKKKKTKKNIHGKPKNAVHVSCMSQFYGFIIIFRSILKICQIFCTNRGVTRQTSDAYYTAITID